MRLSIILKVTGWFLRFFGLMFLWPLAVAAYYEEWADLGGFALAGVLAAAIGQAMWLGHPAREPDLRRIEALAVVACVDVDPVVQAGRSETGTMRCQGREVDQAPLLQIGAVDTIDTGIRGILWHAVQSVLEIPASQQPLGDVGRRPSFDGCVRL